MDPNELVARIRRGDTEAAITDFLAAVPGVTLEMLAVNAMNWQMFDVAEPILRRLLGEEPDNLGAHMTLANVLYGQKRFAEALPHCEVASRVMPEDPWYHSGRCWVYSTLDRPDDLRRTLLEAKRLIPPGRHMNWQYARQIHAMPPGIAERLAARVTTLVDKATRHRRNRVTEPGVVTWLPHRTGVDPGGEIRLLGCSVGITDADARFIIDEEEEIPAVAEPRGATTLWSASFIPKPGLRHRILLRVGAGVERHDGAEVSFRASGPPSAQAETGGAEEIGATSLTMTGRVAADGPAAAFRFEFGSSPDHLARTTRWQPMPGRLNARFTASPDWTPGRFWYYSGHQYWREGPAPNLTLQWPFAQDPNHISGIGFMELLMACWHNSAQHDGYQQARVWECSDLRDSEVSIRLRTEDFDARDYLHCLGVGNVETYWMLTGQAIELAGKDGGDATLTFRLPSDPSQWTFAGNNPAEQSNHERYGYGPLDGTLGRNQGNLVFIAPFGAPTETTAGEVAFGDVTVTYRDNNILHPDNGARLVEWPATSPCDPGRLTNGVYGDPEAGWFQWGGTGAAPRFVWELPKPMAITALVMHQDPVLPTATCRVTLSGEAGGGDSWDFDLPALAPPFDTPTHRVVTLEGTGTYTTVTIELLAARRVEGIGLQSFEVFAKDFSPPPVETPVTISATGTNLRPGTPVYYRAVCRAGPVTAKGDIRRLDLPAVDGKPLLHQVAAHILTPAKAVFQVRANAMGKAAVLQWRIDHGEWRDLPLGWEQTPVHRYITVAGASPGPHRLTVRATNDAGASAESALDWHMPG